MFFIVYVLIVEEVAKIIKVYADEVKSNVKIF